MAEARCRRRFPVRSEDVELASSASGVRGRRSSAGSRDRARRSRRTRRPHRPGRREGSPSAERAAGDGGSRSRTALRVAAIRHPRPARQRPRARRCTASSRSESSGAQPAQNSAASSASTLLRRYATYGSASSGPPTARSSSSGGLNVRPQRWTCSRSHSRRWSNSPRSNSSSRLPSSLVARSHSCTEITLPSA